VEDDKIKNPTIWERVNVARRKFSPRREPKIACFEYKGDRSVKEDIKQKYGFDGDILDIFVDTKGVLVNKWHHYIPIYDRYLSRFRGTKVKFLEIGVSKGGSLQMWRRYLGDDAVIFGVDIDPDCARYDGQAGQVRIGSQTDAEFLASVIKEMGGVDVILDDGSHHMKHVAKTLNDTFSMMNDGGIYIIEDLHTAFMRKWGGGHGRRQNFFVVLLQIMKDMHGWYHYKKIEYPGVSGRCSGIHVHDSVVVFEKNKVFAPTFSQIS
jgi:hypothetical protein